MPQQQDVNKYTLTSGDICDLFHNQFGMPVSTMTVHDWRARHGLPHIQVKYRLVTYCFYNLHEVLAWANRSNRKPDPKVVEEIHKYKRPTVTKMNRLRKPGKHKRKKQPAT